jgi:hypothetical protein
MTVNHTSAGRISDGEWSAQLTASLGRDCRIARRSVLQQRITGGEGRAVEAVTLQSGQKVIVKIRNGRAQCREALFYRHVLPHAVGLVPAYWGDATTASGWHILILEHLESRAADWTDSHDRALALGALARFRRSIRASRIWLLLRSLRGSVGAPGASSKCLHRVHEEIAREVLEFSRAGE